MHPDPFSCWSKTLRTFYSSSSDVHVITIKSRVSTFVSQRQPDLERTKGDDPLYSSHKTTITLLYTAFLSVLPLVQAFLPFFLSFFPRRGSQLRTKQPSYLWGILQRRKQGTHRPISTDLLSNYSYQSCRAVFFAAQPKFFCSIGFNEEFSWEMIVLYW